MALSSSPEAAAEVVEAVEEAVVAAEATVRAKAVAEVAVVVVADRTSA